jgi:serine/threonine-protein kinase
MAERRPKRYHETVIVADTAQKDGPRSGKLKPGVLITPKVRLVARVGEGAMGEVWRAEHTTLETQVAVKVIPEDPTENREEILERFQREATITAQIKSPHVVQIHDYGITDDGIPYIVMELLEGEDLAMRVERERTLSLRDTGEILSQLAKVLGKAHKLGIVHRDVKPENIFLASSEDGIFVKVFDFGVAKRRATPRARRLTETGRIVGTPEFMSPEQLRDSQTVNLQADLWAMAAVAYNALTGALPFDGATIGELCVSVLEGKYAPVSSLRDDLPVETDLWFAQAFHRDAGQRFASAKEMAQAFLRLGPRFDIADELSESGTFDLVHLTEVKGKPSPPRPPPPPRRITASDVGPISSKPADELPPPPEAAPSQPAQRPPPPRPPVRSKPESPVPPPSAPEPVSVPTDDGGLELRAPPPPRRRAAKVFLLLGLLAAGAVIGGSMLAGLPYPVPTTVAEARRVWDTVRARVLGAPPEAEADAAPPAEAVEQPVAEETAPIAAEPTAPEPIAEPEPAAAATTEATALPTAEPSATPTVATAAPPPRPPLRPPPPRRPPPPPKSGKPWEPSAP